MVKAHHAKLMYILRQLFVKTAGGFLLWCLSGCKLARLFAIIYEPSAMSLALPWLPTTV